MSGIYKTKGIVLKALKYSENSVIVDIYTQEKGLRTFIVSGLNSKKGGGKAGCFQHLNILDIVAYDKGSNMARIKEQRVVYFYQTLPYNVTKSSVGLFALELFRNAVKESEANMALYAYLEGFLHDLDSRKGGLGILPIVFLLNLAQHIGIVPINNRTAEKPYLDMLEGQFVSEANELSLDADNSLHISKMLAKEENEPQITKRSKTTIMDWLIKYYQNHLHQFQDLKSVEVLREIF